jgi:hypothetical protein
VYDYVYDYDCADDDDDDEDGIVYDCVFIGVWILLSSVNGQVSYPSFCINMGFYSLINVYLLLFAFSYSFILSNVFLLTFDAIVSNDYTDPAYPI